MGGTSVSTTSRGLYYVPSETPDAAALVAMNDVGVASCSAATTSDKLLRDWISKDLASHHLYSEIDDSMGTATYTLSPHLTAYLLGYSLETAPWPFIRTHLDKQRKVQPTQAQYAAALSVVGTIYASDDVNGSESRFIGGRYGPVEYVNDSVGMGKTLTGMMIIGALCHLRKLLITASQNNRPTLLPPLLYPQREYLVRKNKLPTFPSVTADDMFAQPLSPYPTCMQKEIDCQPAKGDLARYAHNGIGYAVVPKPVILQWKSEGDRFFMSDNVEFILVDAPTDASGTAKRLSRHPETRRNLPFETAPLTVVFITYSTLTPKLGRVQCLAKGRQSRHGVVFHEKHIMLDAGRGTPIAK